MSDTLRILFIDDSAANEKRVMNALRVQFDISTARVATEQDFIDALDQFGWDLILANYKLTAPDGNKILSLLTQKEIDIPFIFIADSATEAQIVAAIKSGAHDFILHSNLPSLLPAIERELIEATLREHTKNASIAAQQNEQHLRTLLDGSDEIILEFDAAGICQQLWGNPKRLLGLAKSDLLNEEIEKAFPGFAGEALLNKMRSALHQKMRQEMDFSIYVNGTRKYLQARIYLAKPTASGNSYLIFMRDVTANKEAQKQILHLANYDSLTGLPNRTLLIDRLELALASARRHQTNLAVLYLDIDRLNAINESLGHACGDEVLQELAARIKQEIRSHDTVARMHSDEFVIILQNIETPEFAAVVAEKISTVVARPVQVGDQFLVTTLSIGISFFPQNGSTSQTLLENAMSAMQFAKKNDSNHYQFYASEMNTNAAERMGIESGLRLALERGEFKLLFQPQVNLHTGKINSAEALLRWEHPTQGLLEPHHFLSIAEESGLIVPIGKWVMAETCRQLLEWQRVGIRGVPLSINVSTLQFKKKNFLTSLQEIIQQTHLDASNLELELTDNTLLGQPESNEILQALRKLGVTITIDDFGTGYSSLSDLKRFPIDKLKIDQSFIINSHKDADSAAISSAIISLGKHLNLTVVAEGVEDEKDLALLTAQGCDLAQGHLFSLPISAESLVKYIKTNNVNSILQRSPSLH